MFIGNQCKCDECDEDINSGIQCGFVTDHGDLWFDIEFCSWDCFEKHFKYPHLEDQDYIEHFFNDKIEECEPRDSKQFTEKYKDKFLGEIKISKKQKAMYEGMLSFITNPRSFT